MSYGFYLNALGMLCALGREHGEILARAHQGACRITMDPDTCPGKTMPVGRVDDPLPRLPPEHKACDCRNTRLLAAALDRVRDQVQEACSRYGPERIGVVLGSSTSGIDEGTRALAARESAGAFPDAFDLRQQEMGSVSGFALRYLGLQGPAFTLSTACSSSGKAMIAAARLIENGLCDAVVTGGCDTLCQLTLLGFSALEAMSEKITNPMSVHRDGINIGEGAAVFLMSREPSAVSFLGGGESSDAHHMSAPDPEGRGAEESMRSALAQAGLAPGDIGYINLHGTGTPLNDQMESLAVERVFGLGIPCSSTKPLTGHALGAAGAIEAGLCWLALNYPDNNRDALLPRHAWDGCRDPELPELNLADTHDTRVPIQNLRMLSNSFAFGGSNCSVILGRTV